MSCCLGEENIVGYDFTGALGQKLDITIMINLYLSDRSHIPGADGILWRISGANIRGRLEGKLNSCQRTYKA